MFRRLANGELSAQEVCARAVANPEYLGSWKVCEAAQEIASGGQSDDKTLTESMAAASISDGAAVGSTYASLPRAVLPRPTPQHLVLFQRGGPQALEMYHVPPPKPAWNANKLAEQFIYEGEARPASAPQPSMSEDAAAEEEEVI